MTLDAGKLRDRLRGIVGAPAPRPAAPPLPAPQADDVAAAATGQPAAPVRSASSSARGADEARRVLGGEWRGADSARSLVVSRRFDADAQYGRVRVGDLAERLAQAQHAAALLTAGAPRTPFVFFDLETTGLSGGAGTHAFLVGCARFEPDGAFLIEQHLMTDYAAERGMLACVAGDLAGAGALVTFNGKSFDAPVIETRYLFHRLQSPCAALPHVDVLHPARRFWGGRTEAGCSLTALEQPLLGARRVGDVPGFEIPARFFQFIRSGDAQPLVDVFEHNRLDLLSLAGLTVRLLGLVVDGAMATEDPREALALGRLYDRANEWGRAEAAYERAVVLAARPDAARRFSAGVVDFASTPTGMRVEALRSLALGARRRRRYNDAAARWRQVLETPGCPVAIRREATEALAIHHEHRDRDLSAAKMFALKSLEMGSETAWGDAVRHRLKRIERKLVSERSLFPSSP